MEIFQKEYGNDMISDKRAIQKLHREVEKTKRALSSTYQGRVEIEAPSTALTSQRPWAAWRLRRSSTALTSQRPSPAPASRR